MVLKELKDSNFVILQGVVHTLTPLNRIQDLEESAKEEIELKLRAEMESEMLVRELGRAGEFFLENGWKYFFLENNKKLILAAPFDSGTMIHPDNEDEKVYIPKGWAALDINVEDFPNISGQWRLIPRLKKFTLRETFEKHPNTFYKLHPHCFDHGGLCGGMNPPNRFNIDIVVQILKNIIFGSKKEEGTSVWDYNPASPACAIESCVKGKIAKVLHKNGKTDEEVWREIIRLKIEGIDLNEYLEEIQNE